MAWRSNDLTWLVHPRGSGRRRREHREFIPGLRRNDSRDWVPRHRNIRSGMQFWPGRTSAEIGGPAHSARKNVPVWPGIGVIAPAVGELVVTSWQRKSTELALALSCAGQNRRGVANGKVVR